MRAKILPLIMTVALLATMVVPSANAALPADMSWVKYASNPVAATNLCGTGITPARPTVLVESANNYKMYFTTHPGTDGAQIYLATSTDGGLTWTCGNGGSPVLLKGATSSWEENRVTTPTVIKDGTNDYKMWYTGRNNSAVYGIGYATSLDGITWAKYGSNPVLTAGAPGAWDSQIAREPSVVKVGSIYHMWYAGTARWPYFKIGHATSLNGTTWAKDANPVLSPTAGSWDAIETYGPSVVMNGSVFEMFYSGNAGNRWLTGHASSSDGTAWTKDANAIISPSTTGWDNGDSTDYVAAILDGSTWKVFYSGAGASSNYQIGLATLTSEPQLTFRPLMASVGVGSTVDVYIDLTAATNLYGYQFEVNYDPAKLSVTAAVFENSFFDTTGAIIPTAWSAQCASGVCKFGVSKQRPATAVSGSGALAKITFRGVDAGLVPLTFSSDILGDVNGTALTHSTTTGWLQVSGSTATINGTVSLQGRATPIDAGTVTIYEQNGLYPAQTVPFAAGNGEWSATVVPGGTYDLVAAHSLYLSNQKLNITLGLQPTTKLLGGDANNDGKVSMADLTCIGGDFGGAPSTCGGTGSSDINHDGTVNILDLVLAGGNYDLSTPQTW